MLAKKTWRIVAIRQIRQSFLPAKVLFYTVTVSKKSSHALKLDFGFLLTLLLLIKFLN